MHFAVVALMLRSRCGYSSAHIANDLVARIVLFLYVLINAFDEDHFLAMRTFRLLVHGLEVLIAFLWRCKTFDAFHVVAFEFQHLMHQFCMSIKTSARAEFESTFVAPAKSILRNVIFDGLPSFLRHCFTWNFLLVSPPDRPCVLSPSSWFVHAQHFSPADSRSWFFYRFQFLHSHCYHWNSLVQRYWNEERNMVFRETNYRREVGSTTYSESPDFSGLFRRGLLLFRVETSSAISIGKSSTHWSLSESKLGFTSSKMLSTKMLSFERCTYSMWV